MKHRLTQTFPLLLAAALQLLPLMRNIVTSPVAGSSFAFILRWGIGSAAALESVNAVSGATNGFAGGTNLASQPTVFVASISDPDSGRLLKTRFAVTEVADKF